MNKFINCLLQNDNDTIEYINYCENINVTDNLNRNMLHYAVILNASISIVKLLLDKGIYVNQKDYEQWTSLHYYCCYANTNDEILVLLLKSNADINAQTYWKNTPLHFAIFEKKSTQVIQIFLTYGANIHLKNNQGLNALDCAKCNNQREIYKILWFYLLDQFWILNINFFSYYVQWIHWEILEDIVFFLSLTD